MELCYIIHPFKGASKRGDYVDNRHRVERILESISVEEPGVLPLTAIYTEQFYIDTQNGVAIRNKLLGMVAQAGGHVRIYGDRCLDDADCRQEIRYAHELGVTVQMFPWVEVE